MGEVVELHGQLAHLEDDELIENLARFADGTLTEAAVKARHHLSNEDWAALGESDRLVELVEACKTPADTQRRHQRERAQIEIVDGPPISAKSCETPTATNGTGSIQSRHSMRLPAPAPKPAIGDVFFLLVYLAQRIARWPTGRPRQKSWHDTAARPERGARILADYLTIQGFLTKNGNQYALTPDSAMFLNRKSPAYTGGTIQFLLSPELRLGFDDIAATVRKGGTAQTELGATAPEHPIWLEFLVA